MLTHGRLLQFGFCKLPSDLLLEGCSPVLAKTLPRYISTEYYFQENHHTSVLVFCGRTAEQSLYHFHILCPERTPSQEVKVKKKYFPSPHLREMHRAVPNSTVQSVPLWEWHVKTVTRINVLGYSAATQPLCCVMSKMYFKRLELQVGVRQCLLSHIQRGGWVRLTTRKVLALSTLPSLTWTVLLDGQTSRLGTSGQHGRHRRCNEQIISCFFF